MISQSQATCWIASHPGDKRTNEQAAWGGSHHAAAGAVTTHGRAWFHKACGSVLPFGFTSGGATFDGCPGCGTVTLRLADAELRDTVARPLVGCWIAECSNCGTEFEDDDTGVIVHCGTRSELERALIAYKWTVLTTGACYCCGSRPLPGALLDDLASDRPNPDQPKLWESADATARTG